MVYHVLSVRENQFIRVLYWEIEMLLLEWVYQAVFDCLFFSPFLSPAPIIRIFLYYITRKDRAVETISPTRRRRKKQNQKTLCAIILSFLSKVAYFFLVKIITCKMLQENIKILFGQSKNNPQGWMWLVIEARSDAVRAILHRNLECQVHESGQIGSGQTRDSNGERRHSRNQWTKMHWNGWI